MMAVTEKNDLDCWLLSMEALLANLNSTQKFKTVANDAEIAAASALIKRIAADLKQLGEVGLDLVDDAIVESDLVKQINKEALAAKKEAGRIKRAAKILTEITAAVDLASSVAQKVVALA